VKVSRWITGYSDVLDIFDRDFCRFKTVADGVQWEAGAVLDAIEALFFGCGYKLSIANDGG
jgi:hypothetical protein